MHTKNRTFCLLIALTLCQAFLLSIVSTNAFGQAILPNQPAIRRAVPLIDVGKRIVIGKRTEEETYVETGATLKTDPRLESVLEQADRYREDGNYRIATQLWQAVLTQSGDALYSKDDVTYFSLVQQVEGILANLPPNGRQIYRITADANAKEIMAQAKPETRVASLSKVVREYFLSSLGDDAAFELGCIYLDEFDFIGARRMFEKVVTQFPDPSVSLGEVYVRIALCQSFLGESELAEASLALAADADEETVYEQINLVRGSLGKLASQNGSTVNTSWTCRLGNSSRFGVMPNVPPEMVSTKLVAGWQYYFEPKKKYRYRKDTEGYTLSGDKSYGETAKGTIDSEENRAIENWKKKNWRPTGHLLFDSNQVYFKTAADMVSWNTDEVREIASSDNPKTDLKCEWRSLWRNSFLMDDATIMLQQVRKNFGTYGRRRGAVFTSDMPEEVYAVQLFGDEIFQQASIHDGKLYSLEGKPYNDEDKTFSKRPNARWNAQFRRTRTNFLTAYEAESGLTLWRLPSQLGADDAFEIDSEWLQMGGFMSAPIGYANYIIAPVNHSGAIWIYALDPSQNGKTIWKSFLCDEPETGAAPWPAINLSLDGSDLFVSCGVGVVFILDPSSGMVRFARRYKRNGTIDATFRRLNWNNPKTNFEGWNNDVVIPYGRQMVCFSSDSNVVSSYDRNTGSLLWKNPINPRNLKVDYLLGVYNGILYGAGRETIVAFNLEEDGRMIWGGNEIFGDKKSYGRGMLTPDGIYIPVENSIFKFDLIGDKFKAVKLAEVGVELGTTAPVGNLYSDGKQIWVHGANRLYALWPAFDEKDKSTDL